MNAQAGSGFIPPPTLGLVRSFPGLGCRKLHSLLPCHRMMAPLIPTVDERIAAFEVQVRGRILNHAHALASDQYNLSEHAGFAILMLVSSYFEAIEAFYRGRPSEGKSLEFFSAGFLKVFPEIPARLKFAQNPNVQDAVLREIYRQLRCGLYHEGMTKGKIVVRRDGGPLGFLFEPKQSFPVVTIVIDPWHVLSNVEAHFTTFITQLKDPNETALRESFVKCFDDREAATTQFIPPRHPETDVRDS